MNRRGFLGMLFAAPVAAVTLPTEIKWYLPNWDGRWRHCWDPYRGTVTYHSEWGMAFEITEEALADDPALLEAAKRLAYSARHIEEKYAKEVFAC